MTALVGLIVSAIGGTIAESTSDRNALGDKAMSEAPSEAMSDVEITDYH